MHGTLNHLLVTDRIWMQRFTGSGAAPDRLDAILRDDFASLRLAREAEDRRVSSPEEFVQPLSPALDHWFNHHAHHRGQAHALLTGLGRVAPELDLLFYQRLVEAGKA